MKKSAYKRKDGYWCAYAVLSDGRKCVYASTEEMAIEKAVALEEKEKEYLAQIKYTFGNVYKLWFAYKLKEVKPQTCDRIECCFNLYFRSSEICRVDMRKLNNGYVIEWLLDTLNRKPMKYKEFQRILQLFVGVYNYSIDMLEMDECLNWERIKARIPKNKFVVSQKREYALTEVEIKRFVSAVENDLLTLSKPCASALLYCNFFMGLRVGELASIKWSDIDFKKRLLYVSGSETKYLERDKNGVRTGRMVYVRDSTTKTFSGLRTVPLVDSVYDMFVLLKKYHAVMGYETDYVCYDGVKTDAQAHSLHRTLKKICKTYNIREFNTHLIRKTVATRLHNSGVSSRDIGDLLGHSDISTTERNYIISLEDSFEGLRKRLENILSVC